MAPGSRVALGGERGAAGATSGKVEQSWWGGRRVPFQVNFVHRLTEGSVSTRAVRPAATCCGNEAAVAEAPPAPPLRDDLLELMAIIRGGRALVAGRKGDEQGLHNLFGIFSKYGRNLCNRECVQLYFIVIQTRVLD